MQVSLCMGSFVGCSTFPSPPMQYSLCLTTLPMPHARPPGVFMYLRGERLVLLPLGFTSKQQSWGSCSRRIITPSPTGPILPHRLLNRQQAVGSCREKQKQYKVKSQPTCSGFIKWGSSFAKLLFFHSETSGPNSKWFPQQAFLYSLLGRRSINHQRWQPHAQDRYSQVHYEYMWIYVYMNIQNYEYTVYRQNKNNDVFIFYQVLSTSIWVQLA